MNMAREEQTIEIPPFPPLTWTGFNWEGVIHLDAWREFASVLELCPWLDSWERPEGDLGLNVSSPAGNSPEAPNLEQMFTFQHLLDDQAALRDEVLKAIFAKYPALREIYGDAVEGEAMPAISEPDDLLRLISPNVVYVLANPKDGFCRIGFGFDCKWDEEGGLGVLTHRDGAISVGGADEAFREYFAELEDRPA
jgi:hypothetical protein